MSQRGRPGSASSKTAWNDAEFDGGPRRRLESEPPDDLRQVGSEVLPKVNPQVVEVDDKPTNCFTAFIRCLWPKAKLEDGTDEDMHIKTTLHELVFYIFFLIVLGIISFGMTNTTYYNYTKVMKNLFTQQGITPTSQTTFESIGSMNDLWDFLGNSPDPANESSTVQNGFQSGIFSWDTWYNNAPADESGFLYHVNKVLGAPRIRQVKIRNDSCKIPANFRREISACYDEYSSSQAETRPLTPNNTDPSKLPTDLTNQTAWVHWKASETNGTSYTGNMASYDGGGYYVDLSRDPDTMAAIISELKENKWIDAGTRAVMIDFTTYNANINLFCVIKLVVEFPPMGGAFARSEFRTVKLLRYVTGLDYFIAACEVFFVLFLVYYTVEEMIGICRHRVAYFKSLWNLLDVTILILGYVCVLFALYRLKKIDGILDEMLSHPDDYANFDFLAYWQVQFNNIQACLVFFAWVKIFKYISFNKTMSQLSSTLSNCAKDLAGFAIMFFIVFLAFAQWGYLLFGSKIESFSNFTDALFTLFRIILGDFDFVSLNEADHFLGPLYFMLYVFFVFFVLINMFLAIINDTYAEVKEANEEPEFALSDFMKKNYNKMLDKLNLRKDRIVDIQNALNKSDANDDKTIDYEEWRRELKGRGYAEAEIEALFAKFDNDGDRALNLSEQSVMMKELENQKQALDREDANGEEGGGSSRRGGGGGGRQPIAADSEEFTNLQNRVDRMEQTIGSVVSKIDAVLVKLEGMDKAKPKRREAMSKMLDSIRESDASEEQKRIRTEELIRAELDKWDAEAASPGNKNQGESSKSAMRQTRGKF